MTHVIKAIEFANGTPCPHAGQYIESGSHEAYDGRGYFDFTPDIRRAMQFATAGEAFEFWKRQSRTNPRRPDGKPNRPLTALTVMMINTESAT